MTRLGRLLSAAALFTLGCHAEPPDETPRSGLEQARQSAEGCTPTGCGNGLLDTGEACDDGNRTAGDGCSAACLVEPKSVAFDGRVHLRNRTIEPDAPVDPVLVEDAAGIERERIYAIAVFETRPATDAPAQWAEVGVELADFIHDGAWIVSLPTGEGLEHFEALRERIGARNLVAFLPMDRSDASTVAGELPEWAVDAETGWAKLHVQFYRGVDAHAQAELLEVIHQGAPTHEPGTTRMFPIEVEPAAIEALLESPIVEWIEPGPHPPEPLMDAVRANLNLQNTDRPSMCETGDGVRLSTVIETPQSSHPDFYSYDANGNQGPSRILSGGGTGGWHGTHVVGIMLGNGWLSSLFGGTSFQYRGVAPEAEFVAAQWLSPLPSGLRPHAVGSSIVPFGFAGFYNSSMATMDDYIRGDGPQGQFHTQLWAAGNNGGGYASNQGASTGTRGNYAVVAPGKNVISVGNIFAEDFRWASSSMGPSHDGRIKPDISAPGCRLRAPYDPALFDIDYVRIHRPDANDTDIDYEFETQGSMDGWWPWWVWRVGLTGPTREPIGNNDHAARWSLEAGRPHFQWDRHEIGGQVRDVADYYNGNHGGVGKPGDSVEIRYRYVGGQPLFEGGRILFWWLWDLGTSNPQAGYEPVPVVADGGWHTLVIPLGMFNDYPGRAVDAFRISPGAPNPGAIVAAGQGSEYAAYCGTSMASPGATGVMGLLLQKMKDTLNIDLDSFAPSPFDWDTPGLGRPLPSTTRALMLHAARDLARVARATDSNGADTGEPPSYHKGPDYTTGYGAVDGEEAIRLIDLYAANTLPIIERRATPMTTHVYQLVVPPNQTAPIKVTLAWSDPPASPVGVQHANKLINDLELEIVSPSNVVHHPWSVDLPYVPNGCVNCTPPEANGDEPVTTADFVPARRDIKNVRDNLEMVVAETPEPGTWTVRVSTPSLPQGPQTYSLIIGQPPRPADEIDGGKVAFVSDRNGLDQVFVKENVGTATPPVALPYVGPARDPEWSPDGRYVAYVTWEPVSQADQIVVWDTVGTNHQFFPVLFPGHPHLGHPSWHPDGSEIFVGYHDDPEQGGIGAVAFPSGVTRSLYLAQQGDVWSPRAPVYAGIDPTGREHVLVHAVGNCVDHALFRIPIEGDDTLDRVWADGAPTERARFPSVSRDGRRILYAADEHLISTPGFDGVEVVEFGHLEGVTTRRTHQAGDQVAAFAIGGVGEWMAESRAIANGNRELVRQHNGVQQLVDIDDPGNQFDDHHPSWWKANPATPIPDPNAPAINCPAAVAWPPEVAPCGARPVPTATATSVCGGPVEIVANPPFVQGGGTHVVTYTATDRLGHSATCQTTVSWVCTSSN